MQNITEIIEKTESDFLKILVKQMQGVEIEAAEARELTAEFLSLTPFISTEDLQNKIKKFTEKHISFQMMYINLLKYEEEKKTSELINQMRAHIKENRLDEALNLVNNK